MYLVTENDIGSGLKIVNTPGGAGAKVAADLGYGLSLNGNAIDMAYPKPSGAIQIVKIALTGTATAEINTTQHGSTIAAYAWSGAGVTFTSPSAQVSNYTVPASGAYTISLTVTNDKGETETFTRVVKHDRIIEVVGQDSEQAYFGTLQSAHDWINANDSSNSGLYRIHICGATADTSAITITLTQLVIGFISGNSLVTQTINCAQAGALYIWGVSSGESGGRAHIATTGTNECIVATGGNVLLKNLTILSPANTVNSINRTGGTGNIQLDGCRIARGAIAGTVGALQIIRTQLNNGTGYSLNYSGGGGITIYHSLLAGTFNWTGTGNATIIGSHFSCVLAAAPVANYAFKLDAAGGIAYVVGCLFDVSSAGGAVTNHGVCIRGTGSRFHFCSNVIDCGTSLSTAALNYSVDSTAYFIIAHNAIYRSVLTDNAVRGIANLTTFAAVTWTNAQLYSNVYRGAVPAGTTFAATTASGTNISLS